MESDKAREASVTAQRLLAMTQRPEWKEFLQIAEEEYLDLLERASHSDDPEARGGIKFIESFFSKIQDDIKFGITCRKNLYDKLTKTNVRIPA